jgi:PIN domain nuclease of toxin-antitoxin system
VNFLLDACSFLWVTLKPEKLSSTFLESFSDPGNTVFLSSVTTWEIGIKYSIGKLTLPATPRLFVPEERENHHISKLELEEADTFHLETLPFLHKDPFDRMLVCQAIERSLTILTPDPLIRQYPIRTIW